jgi:hypothetical protein
MAIAKNAVDASARGAPQPPTQPHDRKCDRQHTYGELHDLATTSAKSRAEPTPIVLPRVVPPARFEADEQHGDQPTATSGPISHGSGVLAATRTRASATATACCEVTQSLTGAARNENRRAGGIGG